MKMKNVTYDILSKKQLPQAMTAADGMLDARRRAAGSIASQPTILDCALKRRMTTEWERHSGHFVSGKHPNKREGLDREAGILEYLSVTISDYWGYHLSSKLICVGDECGLPPSCAASISGTLWSPTEPEVDRGYHHGTARRMSRPAFDADTTLPVCAINEAVEAFKQQPVEMKPLAAVVLVPSANVPQLSEKIERLFRSIPTDCFGAWGSSTLIHNFSK